MLREESDGPSTGAGAELPPIVDEEQYHRSSREIVAERERFRRVLPHQEYLRRRATLGRTLDGRVEIIERRTGEALPTAFAPTFFGLIDHPTRVQSGIEDWDVEIHNRGVQSDLIGFPSLREQLKAHYRAARRNIDSSDPSIYPDLFQFSLKAGIQTSDIGQQAIPLFQRSLYTDTLEYSLVLPLVRAEYLVRSQAVHRCRESPLRRR